MALRENAGSVPEGDILTFINGRTCDLRVLEGNDAEFTAWQEGVLRGITLKFTLTGSIPMKYMDIREEWKREMAAGALIFGIWRKGKLVGTTGLYTPYPVYSQYAFRIIIWDADSVGKGVGTEATWMVTDYGFRALNCHRIWLGVHEDNKGAIKVYEKVGYKLEGVLRDAIFCYGKFSNTRTYSMLRPEWESYCRLRGMETKGQMKDFEEITV